MKRVWTVIAALIVASVILTGVFGAHAGTGPVFSDDRRCTVQFDDSGSVTLMFSPLVSGPYDLYAFGAAEITRAEIRVGSDVLARGSGIGHILTAELSAGKVYVFELEGSGLAEIELMQHAAGRSILLPRDVQGIAKGTFALPGSVMWYRAETDAVSAGIYITPDNSSDMLIKADVYAEDGTLAASSSEMAGGGCMAYFEPVENGRYFIRVYSPAGSRGGFSLRIIESDKEKPESVETVTDNIVIREGDMRSLKARTGSFGAGTDLIWVSSDAAVAEVNQNGVVTGISEGTAQIFVYAYGGLCATVDVAVNRVQPEYIAYRGDYMNVRVGDVLTPSIQIYPAAAADDESIVYSSSNEDVILISGTGEITAVSEGQAVISAAYGDLRSEMTVNVEEAPVRYRVLMISEQNYAQDVNTVRIGAVNTVNNLEALFSTASYDGSACDITVKTDITADEAYAAIDTAFAGAQEKDVSIFYISCHGYYENGMTMLQFVDGSEIAACDLERALRKVPGTVVVIADCCDSGGLIGSYEDMARMNGGIITAFSGEGAVFSSTKYKVIASAGVGQDSYRLGYAAGENDAVTVFAWALCDALGWDVDDNRRGALNADTNYDGRITLWEAYLYTDRRVMWYLSRAGTDFVQDVQVYPEGDMFVLFER